MLVLICVWAWPSYRATHGKAVLGTALVFVEGYRSPDEALVCLPTAANLNLYREGTSWVNWHSDNEPLFGGSGVHKLIVSVSFGAPVLFKWRSRSCLDSGERSCWLGHGDILVMDGQCQDDFFTVQVPV